MTEQEIHQAQTVLTLIATATEWGESLNDGPAHEHAIDALCDAIGAIMADAGIKTIGGLYERIEASRVEFEAADAVPPTVN